MPFISADTDLPSQYMIVPTLGSEAEDGCANMRAVYDYVQFIIEDEEASAIARDLGFAPLPTTVRKDTKAVLDQMTCMDR